MPWPSDSTASDSLSSSFGWRYTCGTVAPDSGAVFSYDSVGNRTDHSAIITAGDRLASFNGDTISYDDDGNMIRRYNPVTGADHRYVWNALGQLDSAIVVSAIDPQSGQRTTVAEHYVYDAGGRLVHVDGSPNTGWLVYQGDQVSEVVQSQSVYTDVAYDDGTDRPAMEYIHTLPSDEWRAEVIDPMGNLAGTVNLDSIGVPHTWDAWGRNTSTMWDAMDALGWKGLQPETGAGLIYMRARWYDPTLGRFISEDPASLAGGINPYVFAGDDPINQSDPSGACPVDAVFEALISGRLDLSSSFTCTDLPPVVIDGGKRTPFGGDEPADVPPTSLVSELLRSASIAASHVKTEIANPKCTLSVLEGVGHAVETGLFVAAVLPEVSAAVGTAGILAGGRVLFGDLVEAAVDPQVTYFPGKYSSVMNGNMSVAKTMLSHLGLAGEDALVSSGKGESFSFLNHLGGLVPGLNVALSIRDIRHNCN